MENETSKIKLGAEVINLSNSNYETTALTEKQYPSNAKIDITFVGRSNVGKSSLINGLLNRKALAKVGHTPGKTRQINFFNIDQKIYFVDLPGYGYSKMSKEETIAVAKRIDTYFEKRTQLKLAILVLDIRHKPSKDDETMLNYLEQTGLNYIIVATKADKIAPTNIANNIKEIRHALNLKDEIVIFPFSSLNKKGKDDIWNAIINKLQ